MTSASEIGPAGNGIFRCDGGAAEDFATPQSLSMDTQSPSQERSALILYGSETGNAQEVAEELGALAERLRFATHVSELNQSKPVSCNWPRTSLQPQLTYSGR